MDYAADSFGTVADLLPEAMLLVRADGAIERGNTAFISAFGYAASELHANVADISPADPAALADYLRHCSASRQLVVGALTLRRRDGSELACRCEGAALTPATADELALVMLRFVPKESSVSRFVALTQKISELSGEILRRQQAETELRAQRELLEVTLTSIGDAVITTDAAGRVMFMNGIAETLTGWTFADASGRAIGEVFCIINQETRATVENPVDKVLALGQIVGLANHTVLVGRDGSERPIDDSGAPIVGAEGRLHGVVLVFRDVTELRRAEYEQLAARRAAESANHAKDQFLAVLSHELRTPLNAILGWSRMLIRGTVTADRRLHGLSVIERNAEVQARLVEDLLDVSRITAGKLQIRRDAVDLAAVLQAAVESVQMAAESKQLRLTVSGHTGIIVLGDRERLQQVFWNVLVNAVKFTPAGGQVDVLAATAGAFARISIRDTGDGFHPSFRKFMFDAFSQEDGSFSRPHGGLGLGLTIVRRLVEAHGGTIDADSPGVGQGATFVLTLPLGQTARQTDGGADGPVGGLAGLGILLVDNKADSSELMSIVLESGGATVIAVEGIDAALDRLRRQRFDAILIELDMPAHVPFALVQAIRAMRDTPHGVVPLIAITAFASANDSQAVLASGFDAHVSKPVDPERLASVIGRARASKRSTWGAR